MTFDAFLREQAALSALGKLGSHALRATIDRALDEGIFLDDFIDAVHPGPHPPFDQPGKAFRALLAARGIGMPDRRQAIRQVIASHALRLADERNDARVERAAMIDSIYDEPELREQVTTCLGDAFGIERSIGNHWAFDDLDGSPDRVSCGGFLGAAAIDHLKHLTRLEALRWLQTERV